MLRVISNIVIFIWIFVTITIIYKSNTAIYEGLDVQTKPTGNERDPLYISTVNSANIQVLRDEIRQLSALKSDVANLGERVEANTDQITRAIMSQ